MRMRLVVIYNKAPENLRSSKFLSIVTLASIAAVYRESLCDCLKVIKNLQTNVVG